MPKPYERSGNYMNSLLSRDQAAIWHPFTPLKGSLDPLPVVSAEGVYLHLEDGRKVLDAISSWWVNLHGHSHPLIAERISEQAKNLEHVIFAGFTHEPAITLAENLKSILPKNIDKIFFSDDGSTAVEVALKMAIQFWRNQSVFRHNIIAIKGAYHGDTFGAMSVGDRGPFSSAFSKYLFDVDFLDFPQEDNLEDVFRHFKKLIDSENAAAFIYEPLVLGAAGMKMYPPELLDDMIKYAQDRDVICIADEVMTGFGRTGPLFASDLLKTNPDIICLSKGITGGTLALGATGCSEKIIDAFRTRDLMKTFFHGHSFTANPIACAAANASFELLMRRACALNRKRISAQYAAFIKRLKPHPKVSGVRVLGTIMAFDLITDEQTSYVNEARHKLYPYFLDRNVLLRPLGNVVYILPPYIISDDQLQDVFSVIEEMLSDD